MMIYVRSLVFYSSTVDICRFGNYSSTSFHVWFHSAFTVYIGLLVERVEFCSMHSTIAWKHSLPALVVKYRIIYIGKIFVLGAPLTIRVFECANLPKKYERNVRWHNQNPSDRYHNAYYQYWYGWNCLLFGWRMSTNDMNDLFSDLLPTMEGNFVSGLFPLSTIRTFHALPYIAAICKHMLS